MYVIVAKYLRPSFSSSSIVTWFVDAWETQEEAQKRVSELYETYQVFYKKTSAAHTQEEIDIWSEVDSIPLFDELASALQDPEFKRLVSIEDIDQSVLVSPSITWIVEYIRPGVKT